MTEEEKSGIILVRSAWFDFFRFCVVMKFLLISQAIVAILLTVSILLQNRGSGLGGAFGGDFGSYYAKRGLEKFLLYATVLLAIVFVGLSLASVRYGSL